ncbi:hypothetical protein [Epilithonimonas sp.]|uniref:hypothetical protein n=1 Tax=Epilithonimonas sp. TaxID=2894511 RepID=UPI0028994643|nr:hypothetical protein [Epilithonimonas sp.]
MGAQTPSEKNMAMPPRFGIFLRWELRDPGSSIRFFLLEIFIIAGMEIKVIKKENTKPKTSLK